MKKAEIQIGHVYRARVSGKLAGVRIKSESPYGGWNAVNIVTQRDVRIKSAARLRYEIVPTEASRAERLRELRFESLVS